MAILGRFLLLSVALCGVASAVAAGDAPFVLVSKTAKFKRISETEEDVTISYTIYNTGSSIAYDVGLNDDVWPADEFSVSGNSTKTWEKLEGGSSVKHSLIVKPKAQIVFEAPPATVSFRLTNKPKLQTALSTPLGPLGFLQPQPKGARWAWLKDLALQFGPLVSALSIVALGAYIVFMPLSAKKGSKKRR